MGHSEERSVSRIGLSETSVSYKKVVDQLVEKMELGDEFSTKVIAAMALLIAGWRYGDKDPVDPDGPDDGEIVEPEFLKTLLLKRAA